MNVPPDDHLGDRLSGLLDGELSPSEEAAARGHLAGCSLCRSELEEVSAVRALVRGLPPVDAPFGFYERLLLPPSTGRAAARPGRRRMAVGFAAAAASAAVALFVVGLGSPQDAPVAPRVDQLVEAHTTAGVTSDPVTELVSVGVPATFAP